jgi:kumamolisin
MRHSLLSSGAAIAVLAALAASSAQAGPPVDLGPVSGDTPITLTVSLPLSNRAAAEALMIEMATPGSPQYGHFLSSAQVAAQFGPREADVQQVISTLQGAGLSVTQTSGTTLSVRGSASAVGQAFSTRLDWFSMPATGKSPAFTFKGPALAAVVPAAIASKVGSVVGLSDQPVFHSNMVKPLTQIASASIQKPTSSSDLSARFGVLTVLDFEQVYDVTPLIDEGITGQGRTIGIVTLAGFNPQDAFDYWADLGIPVNPNRLTIVNVDGGSIAADGGQDETTLDVQQSGGIASGANIIVYEGPNSSQGFLDTFVTAIAANVVDSASTSFGEPEVFDFLNAQAGDTVTDPLNGEQVSFLQALHQQLVIAALQGQSISAAAGDSGAFDTVRDLGFNEGFTDPLSVDYPGSDPALTSAGGTTLPGPQTFNLGSSTLTINNPVERVWGWDYLEPLCEALGFPATTQGFFDCGIFSVGGGGGISVFFTIPFYQAGIFGTQLSQPGQALIETSPPPAEDLFNFPAFFPGRNVPDASFNADPETGYVILFTDAQGQQVFESAGGTSFVAPQLNGVSALLDQKVGHRIGLLAVHLDTLERLGNAFTPFPAIRTINTGDNWFFKGRNGYSPAVGVGTLDVTNLAGVTF